VLVSTGTAPIKLHAKNATTHSTDSSKQIIARSPGRMFLMVSFLAKDLKTSKKNKIETQEIIDLLRKIRQLRNKKILVIKSQVPVGFTRKLNWKKSLKTKKLFQDLHIGEDIAYILKELSFGKVAQIAYMTEYYIQNLVIIGKLKDFLLKFND
jgi:hypothetical protein